MTARLVLDSEALSALGRQRSARQDEVRAALRAAQRLHREAVVPTVVLAELYRGPHRNQFVDACLARETGIATRDTDRPFARVVGGVLAGAGAGSGMLAYAHVVAAAVETGGGVVLTGDPADMTRLAAPYPTVIVQQLP